MKSLLNLRKADLPEHLKLDDTYDKVAIFISSLLKPKSKDSENLPCTSIYGLTMKEIPDMTAIALSLMEIKWNLKAERIVDAKNKADDVEKSVIKWCG